jgi:L-asparaginase
MSIESSPAARRTVAYFALGGTISMSAADGGVVARLSGDDLVAAVPDLAAHADVMVQPTQPLPSASLTYGDILTVAAAAGELAESGIDGIVLTQGTDTLEETAFLVDSVWAHETPFVLTGAMRNPTLPGDDGPANLLAAVQVAASPLARGRGALVVFDDQIHAARHVRKTHTTSTATFLSPDLGPIGHLVEDRPRLLGAVPPRTPLAIPSAAQLDAARVGLYTATLDDTVDLAALSAGQQGLVVAGFGGGHVAGRLADGLGELAARVPVVLTSRAGAGSVLTHTYGAVGSERDLLERGLISGGFVHPYKALILLRLLIATGADAGHVAAAFAELG